MPNTGQLLTGQILFGQQLKMNNELWTYWINLKHTFTCDWVGFWSVGMPNNKPIEWFVLLQSKCRLSDNGHKKEIRKTEVKLIEHILRQLQGHHLIYYAEDIKLLLALRQDYFETHINLQRFRMDCMKFSQKKLLNCDEACSFTQWNNGGERWHCFQHQKDDEPLTHCW